MTQPLAFISYSHDSREHADRVLALADQLRRDGIDCVLDQYETAPPEGWTRWMDRQIRQADFVLMVCTETYNRRVMGEEEPGVGRGVKWEGTLIYQHIYDADAQNTRLIPVLFEAGWTEHIPKPLKATTYYLVDTPSGYEALYRRLTDQPEVPKPELGMLKKLPPRERKTDFLVDVEPSERQPLPKPVLIPPRRQPFEPELIHIPAGEFLMGSDPKKDKEAFSSEQPQHTLYLPDYFIAKTPVTNAQYLAFVEATGKRPPQHWKKGKPKKGKKDHPVVEVNWYDAVAYCQWLAKVTGKPYRLPSEAEWEKAARGADGRLYPWGDAWDAKRCNTAEGGPGDTTPVGAYPEGASPYEVLDMAGNVWEWTLSLWGKNWNEPDFKYPYKGGDGRENLIDDYDILRVLRGGAFGRNGSVARCAARGGYVPDDYLLSRYYGFRVCVSAQ